MSYSKKIEQWRQIAEWESKDIPANLVLSIIRHESGGEAGRPSRIEGTPGNVPLMAGGSKLVDRSYGLMQIQPAIVAGWNKRHTGVNRVFFEDISGQNARAARLQVRLGAWHYGSQIAQLHKHFPDDFPDGSAPKATPDQLKLALIAYAAGGNWENDPRAKGRGLGPKLLKLKARGKRLTFDALRRTFPNWIPGTLDGVEKRWQKYLKVQNEDPLNAISPIPDPIGSPTKKKGDFPFLMLGGLALGGLWLLQKQRNPGTEEEEDNEEEEEEEEDRTEASN